MHIRQQTANNKPMLKHKQKSQLTPPAKSQLKNPEKTPQKKFRNPQKTPAKKSESEKLKCREHMILV
jgi:hypothetical protein